MPRRERLEKDYTFIFLHHNFQASRESAPMAASCASCVSRYLCAFHFCFVVTALDLSFPTLRLACGICVRRREASSKEQFVVHEGIIEREMHI